MTARVSFLGKIQAWVAERMAKSQELPEPAVIEPMVKLPRILIGMAQSSEARRHGVQLMLDSINSDHLNGKCNELLQEGERYRIALLLQGVGHVKVDAVVEWVLIGNYNHSVGLRIDHDDESRETIGRYVQLLREGSRG